MLWFDGGVFACHNRSLMFTPLTTSWTNLKPNVRGALLVTGGAFFLVMMAPLAKYLSQSLPVAEIVFVRFLAGFLVLFPVIWRRGFENLRTGKIHLHLMRGGIGYLGNLAFFFAIAHIAIGDAITIQFSRPLFMVLIAGLFLGEVVGRRRISVTLIGFLGIIMITRPFGGGFEPWVLVAVGGAVSSTLVALLIKLLTRTEDTLVIMFYFAFFTTLLAAIPALIAWQPPTALEWGLLILTGTFGIVGQSMFTHGLGAGEISFVLPFDYLRIVFGFIFGIAWFNEIPAPWSYAGAATIVLSSIYLLKTEARKKT